MNQIPHDEPVFQISIVSRMVGLHQQTIRSYERVGLIRPARSAGNTRLYSQEDVERLQQVVRLVNDLGVNLAGVEVILHLREQIDELTDELNRTRRKLEELRAATQDGGPNPAREHEGHRGFDAERGPAGTGGDGR